MLVHIIADSWNKIAELETAFSGRCKVSAAMLDGRTEMHEACDAVVVAANLRIVDNITQLKKLQPKIEAVRRRFFVVDEKAHLSAVQAYALGATRVVFGSARADLLSLLIEHDQRAPGMVGSTDPRETALAAVANFDSMFLAVSGGHAIDVVAAETAGSRIIDSVSASGLTAWLDTVRRHHEGTYQHCLLVTGIAADFGLSLKLARRDIQRLTSAAMFHDIGKAKVPRAVLDKPGKLDPQERALIETHPVAGFEVLQRAAGVSAEVLDAVRHHHEFLDGSGYPDGLCGQSISDVVRMLTISDVFAALIEERRYKPAMPRERAYEILGEMRGKLERALVSAFRPVALQR